MANIKSAKKRILVAKTRNERNKSIKSAVKTAIKKVDAVLTIRKLLPLLYWLLLLLLIRLLPRVCIIRIPHPEKYPAWQKLLTALRKNR